MLDRLLRAQSIAVVGASKGKTPTGADKLGAAALRYLVEHGFEGEIYPVNPKERELLNRRCYASLRDIPGKVDLALLLVPAPACLAAMEDCAAKGVGAAVVFASGFAEAGESELQERLISVARSAGIRVLGPNTNGFVNVADNVLGCISMVCRLESFPRGDIALVTQSGALGGSMLGNGIELGGGFSCWVATGNEADLTVADILEYLIEDDGTNVVAMFLEGIRDPDRFMRACHRAGELGKPVIVYKIGASEASARASASHTGAMVGSDRAFDAMCRRYGIIRVDDAAELVTTAITMSWLRDKLPRGRRVGIVASSGGICGVAADECARWGLEVPELDPETQDRIRAAVPPFGAVRNPVDVTQQIQSYPTGMQDTIRAVCESDAVDGVVLLMTMAAEPRASFYARAFCEAARASEKPIIVAWAGAVSLASEGFPMLSANRVPNYRSARGAVKAMRRLADYRIFLERRAEKCET